MTHVNLKFYGHKEFLSFRATINFAVCSLYRLFCIHTIIYIPIYLYIIQITQITHIRPKDGSTKSLSHNN